MTVQLFLTLLMIISVATSAIVEVIKTLLKEKQNVSYTLVAVITGVIVGIGGTLIYYGIVGMPYTLANVLYSVLMGVAGGLCSTLGYDKIKQIITDLFVK